MPEPGSHAYDTQRARERANLESQGLPDKKANDRANEVLQDELPNGAQEPQSQREQGTGHTGRARDASGG